MNGEQYSKVKEDLMRLDSQLLEKNEEYKKRESEKNKLTGNDGRRQNNPAGTE